VNGGATSDPIERALADLSAGKPVVVVDDADQENEGDLIFAAEKATSEQVEAAPALRGAPGWAIRGRTGKCLREGGGEHG
jgi:3,4-dihydroxy-2-butanone 4-phosphate synthase